MIRKLFPVFLVLAWSLIAIADDDAPWRSKQIAAWTEEDAKQVLLSSPWAKTFTPTLSAPDNSQRQSGRGRGMGGGGYGGGGYGGAGVGMPGMGRRGMGNYPNSNGNPSSQSDSSITEAPQLTLRWESAMPIRTAELKARENDPVSVEENHYAIAVYGIPDRMLNGDPQKLTDQFKKEASLKREGKKDFKPSSVRILDRSEGRIVLYLFSMSNEITRQDHRVEFNAKIGRLGLQQSFFVDEMVWEGKLEL